MSRSTMTSHEHPSTLLDGGDQFDSVEEALRTKGSRFTISPEFARALARLVVLGPFSRVLEFGSGLSSLVVAEALTLKGGGHLTSVEHQPRFSTETWHAAASRTAVDAELLVSPLRLRLTRAGALYLYPAAGRRLAARGPYDLVLIDAPPNAFGRDGALWQAYRHLTRGALILLDDAGRRRETATIQRWLQQYGGLRLLRHDAAFGGRGLALLQKADEGACRFQMNAFVSTLRERYRSHEKLPTTS